MNKFWKPFRVIVSLGVLIAVIMIFLDFRQNFSTIWYQSITWLQFIPSLRKFLITAGFLTSGFIVVLLFTLLFGRVYCSFICPFGILQDIISYISKKFRKKKFRYKYAAPKNMFRYGFLALAIIPIFFGYFVIVGLLDPYSNFGRIISDMGQPLYMGINNFFAGILIKMKVYAMSPEKIPLINYTAIIYPVFMLGLIIVLARKWGRLYCNTVCPVGTILGLLSKVSIFKIKIDSLSCTKCAKCAVSCKSQCINLKTLTVDSSRCVGCFNCMNSCEHSSIGYRFSWDKKTEFKVVRPKNELRKQESNHQEAISKRQFITNSVALVGAMSGISMAAKADELKSDKGLLPAVKDHPCAPPGSISLKHFHNACTACHLCVSACPNRVLRPSLLEYGLEGFLQPFVNPSSGYCNFDCLVCGEVCPTGAILPLTVEEKHLTQIGIVKFLRENCIVYTDETLCGACSEHCPTKAVKMVDYKDDLVIPEVVPDICIGCGACEYACPVMPNKAIYVNGNAVQQVAKAPEVNQLDDKALEEFPF